MKEERFESFVKENVKEIESFVMMVGWVNEFGFWSSVEPRNEVGNLGSVVSVLSIIIRSVHN